MLYMPVLPLYIRLLHVSALVKGGIESLVGCACLDEVCFKSLQDSRGDQTCSACFKVDSLPVGLVSTHTRTQGNLTRRYFRGIGSLEVGKVLSNTMRA